jgi:hypothetical protein
MHTEQLPETTTGAKKQQERTVRWLPLPGLTTGTGSPVLGCMEITVRLSKTRAQVCSYIVTETKTAWDGRAFKLQKGADSPGSDAEAENYEVFVGLKDTDRRCGCRGYLRHRCCKHFQALAALIAAGKL